MAGTIQQRGARSWCALTLSWMAFFALFAAPGLGWTAPSSVEVRQVDLTACPRLKAFVAVQDDAGSALKDLEGLTFSASVGLQPAGEVSSKPFSESGEGLAVVMVLDTSGSMKGEPIAAQNAAASSFIQGLDENDRVAVFTFGNEVGVVQEEFVAPSAALWERVEALVPDEQRVAKGTKLYDATHRAIKAVKEATKLPSRRAVVVISDGEDIGSALTADDCIAAAEKANCPIYSIGYARKGRLSRLSERANNLNNLERLSLKTGGSFNVAPNNAALKGIYAGITGQLRDLHVLSMIAYGLKADGQSKELRITLGEKKLALTSVLSFVVPIDQSCPLAKVSEPPPPVPKTKLIDEPWFLPVVVGGGGLAILLVVVFALRGRKQRQELEARRCPKCSTIRPVGAVDCVVCDPPAPPDSGIQQAAPPVQPIIQAAPVPAPAPDPIAQLVVISGGPDKFKGFSFDITEKTTVLGREENRCQILLPDDKTSGVHATIYLGADGFELHDLESSNGTYLNDQLVNESPLPHGSEIRIGGIRMKFFDKRA